MLLLLLLAQLDDPRQHLQARDFLPADVSELSSVDVVELCCGVGVGVVIVVVGGCRQHVADDFGSVPVDTTFAVVAVVDSFVSLPGVVFRIFSSLATSLVPCWDATAHRGHSPTLNGCSSLCRRRSSSLRSLNLSLISHTALAVTIRLGLTGPDGEGDGSGTEFPPAAINCCWRSCCWCCCMVRFRTLALLLIVEMLLSQIVVTEDTGGGVAEVVTARNVPGDVAHDGM